MSTYRTAGMVLTGVAAGIVAAVLLFSGPHPVQAQPAAPAPNGRYQISSWAFGLGSGAAGSKSEQGAYILDTQTGDVFSVTANRAPVVVGSVANAKK